MLHNGLEMNCQQPILKFLTSLVPRRSVIITEHLGTRLVLNLLQILCACTVSSDYGQWRRSPACVSPETLTLLLYCLSLGMAASSDYGQWRSTLACVSPETLTLLLYCLSLGMAAGTDHGQWKSSLACVSPETMCSYGSPAALPIPWGVWDGCPGRLRPLEEHPHLCPISLISLWRDLPQTDQSLSGFRSFPKRCCGMFISLCISLRVHKEGLWYLEFKSPVYIMQL